MSPATKPWFSDSSWGHHLTPSLAANCKSLNQFLSWYWSFLFAMRLLPSLFSRQVVRHQVPFGNLNTQEEEHMTKSLCHTLTSWVLRVVNLVKALQRNKNKELKQNLFSRRSKKKEKLRRDEVGEEKWDVILPIPSIYWLEMAQVYNKLGMSVDLYFLFGKLKISKNSSYMTPS